jgi:hypothetical protein
MLVSLRGPSWIISQFATGVPGKKCDEERQAICIGDHDLSEC